MKKTSTPGGPKVGKSEIEGVAMTGVKRLIDAADTMKADKTKRDVTTSLTRRRVKLGCTSLFLKAFD